jgi:hypothetical protein
MNLLYVEYSSGQTEDRLKSGHEPQKGLDVKKSDTVSCKETWIWTLITSTLMMAEETVSETLD